MSNAGEGGIKPAGESKPLGAPRSDLTAKLEEIKQIINTLEA